MTLFFLLYYFAVLLAGAMFIVGWYEITRGEWITDPDGTVLWSGKIFSGWQRYWEHVKSEKKIYYEGEELEELMLKVESSLGISNYATALERKYTLRRSAVHLPNVNAVTYFQTRIFSFLVLHKDIGYTIKANSPVVTPTTVGQISSDAYIHFYKKEKVYRFPKWVRSPLASCIFCFSSVYGTLVWWLFALLSYFCFREVYYGWPVYFIIWPFYCMSLSFLSPFLEKKL